jgi:AAA domain
MKFYRPLGTKLKGNSPIEQSNGGEDDGYIPIGQKVKESMFKLPKSEEARDLIDEDPPLPEELIKGVLYKGHKMMLVGSSKMGKTWLAVDLAICLSNGLPWLGLPTKKVKVLYLNLEIDRPFFNKRLKAMEKAKKMKLTYGFQIKHLRGFDLSNDDMWEALIEEVEAERPDVVIIDPTYKLLGMRDENSARDVALLLRQFDRLVARTGVASIVVHHFSKGVQSGKAVGDASSGSGVWFRDPDSYIEFKLLKGGGYRADVAVRNTAPVPSFGISWSHPLYSRDDTLKIDELIKPANQQQNDKIEATVLLPPLLGEKLHHKDWLQRTTMVVKMSPGTFDKKRDECLKLKYVERSGTLYFLTPTGEAFVKKPTF